MSAENTVCVMNFSVSTFTHTHPTPAARPPPLPDSAHPDKQMQDKFLFVTTCVDCCIIMKAGAARACVRPVMIPLSERTMRKESIHTDGPTAVHSSLHCCLGVGINFAFPNTLVQSPHTIILECIQSYIWHAAQSTILTILFILAMTYHSAYSDITALSHSVHLLQREIVRTKLQQH